MSDTDRPTTVSLRKRHHRPVRWDCAAEDLDYALAGRPLWWDDASYIRYQSDDGPQGYETTELGFLPDHDATVVKGWIWFDYEDDSPTVKPSRRVRSILASFDSIAVPQSSADRALVYAANPIPF